MLSQTMQAITEPVPYSSGFSQFVSAPASARPLAVFRIGLAAVLLGQAIALMNSVFALYGPQGIVQWSVGAQLLNPGTPHLSWLVAMLEPLGLSPSAVVQGTFLVYVSALSALLIGWFTRPAAILACLTHLLLMTTGNASIYGVDMFAQISLFYCMWMPIGQVMSVDALAKGETEKPSSFARLSLRVLQIHLCVVYFSSGMDKAEGIQWWNGEAIWRSLMRPDLAQYDMTWLASVPWLAMLLCWATLVVELGYAVFVWPQRTRTLWALATIGLHAGIAVIMGLWSFSAVMIVLTGSAFLISAEPARQRRSRLASKTRLERGPVAEATLVNVPDTVIC